MGDLTAIDSALNVAITDSSTLTAALGSSLPSGTEVGLIVRDAVKGQQTMANSRPVVLPSDQILNFSVSTSSPTAYFTPPFSDNFKIFDYKFTGGDNSILWYTTTATGGTSTFNSTEKAIFMDITTTTGSKVTRQSQRILSQGGTTMAYIIPALMGAIKTGTRQRIGVFDDDDGAYFEQDGTNLKIVVRSSASGSVVNSTTNQSSWNIDELDGTGTSGITLDTSKVNNYVIIYSNDSFRFGIIYNETVYFCHRFNGPNNAILPAVATTNLPFRLELEATGSPATSTTMKYYAATAYSSGGSYFYNISRSVDSGATTGITIGSTLIPLISLRLKTANVKNILKILSSTLNLTSGEIVLVRLIHNGSLTGASFTAVPGSDTISEYDTTASAITGGSAIFSTYISNQTDIMFLDNNISSNIAGTSDIITIAAQKTGGASPVAWVSMNFKELF